MFIDALKRGGGVGLLVWEELKHFSNPDFDKMLGHIEAITIELQLPNRKLLVTSMCRPPNTDENLFLKDYIEYSSALNQTSKDYIIGLDHNLNLLQYEHHFPTRKFLEFLIDSEQLPCITRPTRLTHHSATLIDNVIVLNGLYPTQHSGIIISDISDHLPCLTVFENIKCKLTGKNTITICNLGEKKIKKIVDRLSTLDLCQSLNNCDLNTAFKTLHSSITYCID